MSTNCTPFTTRPPRTSRQAMMRFVSICELSFHLSLHRRSILQREIVPQHLQSSLRRLLRMKLHSHHIPSLNSSRKSTTINRLRSSIRRQRSSPRMRVIHEAPRSNASEQPRITADLLQRVPAHMRRLQLMPLEHRREPLTLSSELPKTQRLRSFRRAFVQPLQPNADPEERSSTAHSFTRSLRQTKILQQLRRTEVSNTRKHDLVGELHLFRRLRDDDISRTEEAQRLDDTGEIARLVVDDRDHPYSNPFVLGRSSRIRSSLEHAPRSARANALKIASILW